MQYLLFLSDADLPVHLYGGDIVLTLQQQAAMEANTMQNYPFSPLNAVVMEEEYMWRDGIVYYTLDNSLSM